jgi:hypothetical protein
VWVRNSWHGGGCQPATVAGRTHHPRPLGDADLLTTFAGYRHEVNDKWLICTFEAKATQNHSFVEVPV